MSQTIPTGWKEKYLWEVTDWDKRFQSVTKGKQRKILSFHHILAETMKKISLDNGDIKLLATGKFDGYTTENLAGNNLNEGEVLTLPSGGTASIKYYNGRFVDSGNIIAQSSNKELYYLKYIYYYLISINSFVASKYKGTSIKHPYMPEILDIKIPLPQLSEQQRIVAKLDKAFEAIDKAKTIAETNLKNTKELFESTLNKAFTEDTDGWEEKTLNDVSCNLDSKRIPITKNIRETGYYPYYGASGIVDYVKDYIFDGTFLLISEDGANLLMRNYPIAFSASGKFWVNNHAHILKFNELVTQRFVELYLNHINIQKYITGAAQPKLTQNNLNSIKILFPSLPEQQKIVEKLDTIQEQTKQLEQIYTQKIKECDELKQSILNKAFKGEL